MGHVVQSSICKARMLVEVPWRFPFTGHLQLNGNLQKLETWSWDSPMPYHLLKRRNAECNWCRVRLWHVGQEGWQTFCLVGHCCQMTSEIANSTFRLFSVQGLEEVAEGNQAGASSL